MVKRYGPNLLAGRPSWDRAFFEAHGLHRREAPSAIRELRNHANKTIGNPYAGNRTYGLKGGWGIGTALRTPRP